LGGIGIGAVPEALLVSDLLLGLVSDLLLGLVSDLQGLAAHPSASPCQRIHGNRRRCQKSTG
jgi:hypothetical protein